MKIRVIVAVMVALMLLPALSAASDVIVIGNPSVPVSDLRKKDISKIFLGKKVVWDDKSKIVVVIQSNADLHEKFLKEYVGKSPSKFAAAWKDLVFTGKRSAPKIFATDQEMIKFVSETKGAIGYVSTGTTLDKVKTISVK